METQGREFRIEVDTASEADWNELIAGFADATVYQTWGYNQERAGKHGISNLRLFAGPTLVGAALVRLVKLPVVKGGMAYIGNGPLWRRAGTPDDPAVLAELLGCLRREYAERRGYWLRVTPYLYDAAFEAGPVRDAAAAAGLNWVAAPDHTTLFLDLAPGADDLRKGLHQKWRNQLNNADKRGLSIRSGTGAALYSEFKAIYDEMHARKGYPADVDMAAFARAYERLPEDLRPVVVLAEADGRPMAGAVFSMVGDTAIYLLGATATEGMTNKASYLVQWSAVLLMKARGLKWYDLGGCSPLTVPTTYHFKAGICGKEPPLATRLAMFEACTNRLSRLAVSTARRLGELKRRLAARRNRPAGDAERAGSSN